MPSAVDDARDRGRAHLEAGDYRQALQAASEGLSSAPDDVELLVLAGRASFELDSDDAVGQLQRATELAPENSTAWHHLGEALAAEGRTDEADQAFRRAVELDPEDQIALTHLGHTSLAAGRSDEAVDYLARAADSIHGVSTAAISLVDMYRSFGRYDEAATQARLIAKAVPDDPLAWLDVAELSLEVQQLEEARHAFERLRDLDDVPGHEAYPVYGMLQAAIHSGDWEAASELAEQAAALDPRGVSADVSAFLRTRSGGDAPEHEDGGEPVAGQSEVDAALAAGQSEVEAALAASLAEYRRMLADDRRLASGDSIG